MEDHALAIAFKRIRLSTIRIVVMKDGRDWSSGTGYLVGTLRQSLRGVITTAAHVLPFSDRTLQPGLQIRLEKYDTNSQLNGTVTFSTDPHIDPDGFTANLDKAPGADVAILVAPRIGDDGNPFIQSGDLTVPPVTDRAGPDIATRIAWSGFPGLLENPAVFGRPHLCYFEGVVAAWAQHLGRHYMVVDGHAMPGVSGGPVWFYHDELKEVRVAGIVSKYAGYKTPERFHPALDTGDEVNQWRDRMPGFVFVQPINDLMEFVMTIGQPAK